MFEIYLFVQKKMDTKEIKSKLVNIQQKMPIEFICIRKIPQYCYPSFYYYYYYMLMFLCACVVNN